MDLDFSMIHRIMDPQFRDRILPFFISSMQCGLTRARAASLPAKSIMNDFKSMRRVAFIGRSIIAALTVVPA